MRHRWILSPAMAVGLLACGTGAAQAATITLDLSTNNAGWIASYSVFTGPAFHYACGGVDCISISSNGTRTGTFVGGGSFAFFGGTWSAQLPFFLPANATNVSYSFQSLGVDDRADLGLNGTNLGTFFIFGPQISGVVTAPFSLGVTNMLTLQVVNNAFSQTGSPRPFLDNFDATAVVLQGHVTYDVPSSVPEPGTLALLGVGLLGLGARWRSKRCSGKVS